MDGPASTRSALSMIGVGVAAAALAVAVTMHRSGVPLPTPVLLVGLGGAPLAVGYTAFPGRRRTPSAVSMGAGALVAAAGVALTGRNDSLDLLRQSSTVRHIATNAATELAPVGLVALGLALAVAGVAGALRDRVLRGVATAITVGTCAAFTVALLGMAAGDLAYIGGSFRWTPVWAAIVVFLASLLLPVIALATPPHEAVAAAEPTREDGGGTTQAPSAGVRHSRAARWAALAVVAALLAGAGLWGRTWLAERVVLSETFPDPALAACVASALNEADVTEPVSKRQLDSIGGLSCNGYSSQSGAVRALDGVEHLPNLTGLDLSGNDVRDLSPLTATPRLSHLKLTSNAVSDLRPLEGLTGLTELGLSDNDVVDLTPLAGRTSLTALGLSMNRITNLTPLSGLVNLTDLAVGGNGVTDVSPLAGMTNLTELDIADNQITDVTPLGGLRRLDRLEMGRNLVRDPTPLHALPDLTVLDVRENRISDAAMVKGCDAVEELWLGGNPVTDVGVLRDMKALQGLDLSGSDSSRIEGVEALRKRGIFVGGLA